MLVSLDEFFDYMGQALMDDGQIPLVEFYRVPLVIMYQKQRRVCSSAGDVADYCAGLNAYYRSFNGARCQAQIHSTLKLSENMRFCYLSWRVYDQNDDVLHDICCSYTLQIGETGLKVMVVVVDQDDAGFNRLMEKG